MWVDALFTSMVILSSLSLLPSIFSKHKPAPTTSGMFVVVCTGFVIGHIALELWLTAFFTVLAGLMWGILLIQKLGIFWRIDFNFEELDVDIETLRFLQDK